MKQENDEKSPEQLLKQEATEYYNLAKEYRRDRYTREDAEVSYKFNLLEFHH